jgi:long-subunit fatty acid transport protein
MAGRPDLWLLAALLIAGAATAQQEVPPTFEFSFSNPGARSLGFGGAFVALADDATAAFANPAGLVQLIEPELSIEGRFWSYSTPHVAGGRIFGSPVGIGLDQTAGLRQGESSQDLSGLSFMAFVYPGRHWSVAFYRHQLANYEFSGEMHGLFSGPWPGFGQRREWDLRKTADLEVVSYALSGAYRVTESLSLGLGVAYFEGALSTVTDAFGILGFVNDPEVFVAQKPLVPARNVYSILLDMSDTDWGFNAGLLWSASPAWSVGGFYRQGPELAVTGEFLLGPTNPFSLPAGTLVGAATESMGFPEVFGLGTVFRSRERRLTLSFEWDRVGYSSIADLYNSFEDEPGFILDDADEFHFGVEYAFLQTRSILAVRTGLWLDPAHALTFDGESYVAAAILRPGDDELHFAAGVGVAFERLQLDLGADFSDLVNTISLSAIYSF